MQANKRNENLGRFFWILLLVLIAALIFSEIAYAEGETPPIEETPPAEDTTEPAEEASPLEEAPPEELIDDLEVRETVPPVIEETPVMKSCTSGSTSLSSASSTDVAVAPDPYFKIGTTLYKFLPNGSVCPAGTLGITCFVSAPTGNPIVDALAYMDAENKLPTDRKLYVEGGTYGGFTIDGAASNEWQQLNGVIGVDGSANTFITSDINITNNLNGFLLSGFDVTGGVTATNNTGTLKLYDLVITNSGGNGIHVIDHIGKIELEKINASGNTANGAFLDNTTGNYPVTVFNSSFNGNGMVNHIGLRIDSLNAVTIIGVTASNNKGDGMDVFDFSSLTIKNTILTNNKSTTFDYGYGVYAYTEKTASIKLEHVYANLNDGGYYLETGGNLLAKFIEANGNLEYDGLDFNSQGSSRIEYSSFNDNAENGLAIENKGSIYLNSISADNNGFSGVDLDNAYFDGDVGDYTGTGIVTITSPKTGSWLTLNSFNSNGDKGIAILSRRSVSISNFNADQNTQGAISIDNTFGTGSVRIFVKANLDYNTANSSLSGYGINIISNGAVSITDTVANYTAKDGFNVNSMGTILLKDAMTIGNMWAGARLLNIAAPRPRSVTIINGSFANNKSGGLYVETKGLIMIKGISASENDGWGAYLDNTAGTAGVSINNTKEIPYNILHRNSGYGLRVYSNGAIKLNMVSADDNPGYGAYLDNPDSRATVKVLCSLKKEEGCTFNSNGVGIYIRTRGGITLQNIDTNSNDRSGADLDNCLYDVGSGECLGFGSITIKGHKNISNDFYDNAEFGLLARSHGAIKLTNVSASSNGLDGIFLKNYHLGAIGSVSLKVFGKEITNYFGSNGWNAAYAGPYTFMKWSGITVETNGSIVLQNVSTEGHSKGYGVFLRNDWSPYVRGVTINNGVFVSSFENGLYAAFRGPFIATNLTAYDNGKSGVCLYSNDPTGNVTIKSSKGFRNEFNNNNTHNLTDNAGLFIFTYGSVSINNVDAKNNKFTSSGLRILAVNDITPKPVYLSDIDFLNNGEFGLYIFGFGRITVKSIISTDNGDKGTFIDNSGGTAPVTISTLSSKPFNSFVGNGDAGLFLISSGPVYISNVSAAANANYGVYIDNSFGSGPVVYKTTGETRMIVSNTGYGMVINSAGAVTLKNSKYMMVGGNTNIGVQINNQYAVTPQNVLIKNVFSTYNNEGFNIMSNGNITATSIMGIENTLNGAVLSVDSGQPGNILVNGTNTFSENGAKGLYVWTDNTITVANAVAKNNDGDGIFAESYGSGYINFGNITSYGNKGIGLYVSAHGNVTMNYIRSFNNGFSINGDGLYIIAHTGELVTIKNSMFQSNDGSGIHIVHPDASFFPTLINTSYLGNDVDVSGDPDISIHM